MANSTIDFGEILAGQKGSEVSNIIMENLKKLSTRIVELEDEISNLKKQGFDGSTVIDQTGSVTVSYNPTVVIGKSVPTYMDYVVTVKVMYGNRELIPGTDNSSTQFSYSLANSIIIVGGYQVATITQNTSDGILKFNVRINPNAVSDSSFRFNIIFKGNIYNYDVPILILNDKANENGRGIFVSTIFKRLATQPSTPTGGNFDSPYPTTQAGGVEYQGWSDGIPSGSEPLWASHRRFTSDGVNQDDAWSEPVNAQDSSTIDIAYSAYSQGIPKAPSQHGSQMNIDPPYYWHDNGEENDIWMAMSVKNGSTYGDWSILKIKGENGLNGDWRTTVYREFNGEDLAAPTLRDPNGFDEITEPSSVNYGWKDGPSSHGVWWMSTALVSGANGELIGDWSKPVKITQGEGAPGQSVYLSTVFKRGKNVEKPLYTEGNYTNPVPNGWSDGIPADDSEHNPVWETHRRFTNDGLTPQDTSWSEPKLMLDTADFDCCYSSYNEGVPPAPTNHGVQEGEIWHNDGQPADIWMATSHKRSQGEWSAWTITKIIGENGRNGDYTSYIFKQSDTDKLDAPTLTDPHGFDAITDPSSVNYGWQDGPGVGDNWWMSCALIDGETGLVDSSTSTEGWSTPKKLQGEKGEDGSYNEYQYAANTSMTEYPSEWKNSVQEVYDGFTGGVLPSNYFMWMKQRSYDPSTKEFDEWEYMRITGERGEPGASISIKGNIETYEQLFNILNPNDGDSYMVFGDLWVYNASNASIEYDKLSDELKDLYNPEKKVNFPDPGHWRNCGRIVGASGTSTYLHVKYADVLDNTDEETNKQYPSDMKDTPSYYIGVLVDHTEEASEDATLYQWAQFTGDDGYGYEYVYRRSRISTPYAVPTIDQCTPNSGKTFQDDDYVPPVESGEPWTDNPMGVNSNYPYEFMVKRVKKNNKWEAFTGSASDTSKAILYSYLGKDAPYTQRQWAAFQSLVLTNGMKDDTFWQVVIPNVESGYYLWERSRTVTPARGASLPTYSAWQYERRTGEKGNTGNGLAIKGTKNNYHELFILSDENAWKEAHPDGTYVAPADGDCYIVNGHLWSWVESAQSSPADSEKYATNLAQKKWRDGGNVQGPQGISGGTAYLHIKFANQATYVSGDTYAVTDASWLTTYLTTNDGEAPGRYIGMYTDTNEVDEGGTSQKYKWTKYTGDDGLYFEYIYTTTSGYTDVDVPYTSDAMLNGSDTKKTGIGGKKFQDNDYVPKSGSTDTYDQPITNRVWTDDPVSVSETNMYQWCCKREKANGLWGAWTGKAGDTSKAFLYNKYGDSALEIDVKNQTHVYTKNISGNCDVETVICDINAHKDGTPREVTKIEVSGSTNDFATIDKFPGISPSVRLTNKPSMASTGGTLSFVLTVDGNTYVKSYVYTVVDDGTPGMTIAFSPSVIVAQEDIKTSVVSTATTYSILEVTQDGVNIKYNNTPTTEKGKYQVYAVNTDKWANKITYGLSKVGDKCKFHISDFNKNKQKPYGGTAWFNIVYNGQSYLRSVDWTVNWLGTWRHVVSGDVSTTISESVTSYANEQGYINTQSASTLIEQSANGLITQINDVKTSVSGVTKQVTTLQADAKGFMTRTEADGKYTTITQVNNAISLKVGNITKSIRPNLLPNTLMSQYISHYACYPPKTIELPGGLYTLSARGRFISQGMINGQTPDYMRIIAYMYDNDWSHTITFNTTDMLTKSLELNVPNGGSKVQIGWYLGENQYAQIGSKFYLEYLKLESGSGATEYVISNYDSATSNSIVLSPYEVVTKYNITARNSNYTLTTHSTPEGNYVKIGNSTAISDWQLIYPKEALKLSDFNVYGPTTWYFWCVARNPNAQADDYFNFGSELIHPSEGRTGLMDLTALISTKNSLQHKIPLSNGWSLYYASVLQRLPAIPQLNLLSHPEMTRKVKKFMFKTFDGGTPSTPNATRMSGFTSATSTSVNYGWQEKPTSFINLWCSYCTATYTSSGWVFSSWSTPSEINGNSGNNISYALGSSPKNAPLHNENWNTDPKEVIKPHTTIPSGMYLWRKIYNSGSYSYECLNNADDDWKWSGVMTTPENMNGGVVTYQVSNLPESPSLVELLKQDITNALAPGRWYTLSFKAKDGSGNKGYVHTYMYSTDGNTVGDNTNSEKGYVTIGNVTTHLTSIAGDNYYRWQFSNTENTYSYTFKVPTTWTKEKPSYLLFRVTSNDSKGKSYGLSISNIKLEQCSARTRYNESEQNRDIYLGFNTVHGTWDILDAGISKYGIPSISSINSKLEAANQRTALLDTGIDIEDRKVTITSDNFIVKNNEGNQTFLIDEFGKVNVNVLNADSILTNALSAKTINANSATFTNLRIAGESSFGGLVKKIKTTITKDNILNYANKDFTEGSKLKIWSLEKLGTWIEIQSVPDNYILLFELPSISAYDVNGNPYDSDKLNYARSMVGNTLIITNKTSRPLNVRSYISTGIGEPGDTVNYIYSGYTMSLTCKMRPFPNKDNTYSHLFGYEEIYWEGVTMKTSPEKETT